jgi:L-rhamnose mutarotase
MQLRPGCELEYRRRHDQIWPELSKLLSEAGIYDYSIFLDPETLSLFAVLKLRPDHGRGALADHPIMRRWWDHMADLMEVRPDNRPIEHALAQVFHLP